MIINIKSASNDHMIARELRHLADDSHTPSGMLIRDGIEVKRIVRSSTQVIYQVEPRSAHPNVALAIISELKNRSPELLMALLDTARRGSPFLEVHVEDGKSDIATSIDASEKLMLLPLLIAWLSADRVKCPEAHA